MKKLILLLVLIPSIAFGGWYYHATETGGAPAFPNTSVLSTFTGSDFTQPTGFSDLVGNCEIISNMLAGANVASNICIWDTTYTINNMEAYIEIITKQANGDQVMVYATNASYNGYVIEFVPQVGTDTIKLYTSVGGSETTQLGSTVNQEVSSGDAIGIKVNGSAIQTWYKPVAGAWSLIIDTTDSTYSDCNTLGIMIAWAQARLDNFGGGTP